MRFNGELRNVGALSTAVDFSPLHKHLFARHHSAVIQFIYFLAVCLSRSLILMVFHLQYYRQPPAQRKPPN